MSFFYGDILIKGRNDGLCVNNLAVFYGYYAKSVNEKRRFLAFHEK